MRNPEHRLTFLLRRDDRVHPVDPLGGDPVGRQVYRCQNRQGEYGGEAHAILQ
jgi:hypothetical protein